MTSSEPVCPHEGQAGFWSARSLNRSLLVFITVFVAASLISDVAPSAVTREATDAPDTLSGLLTGLPFFLLWTRSTFAFAALVPALVASHALGSVIAPVMFTPLLLGAVAATAGRRFSFMALGVSLGWALFIPITSSQDVSTLWFVLPYIILAWAAGHYVQQNLERRDRDRRRVAEATRKAAHAAEEERRLLARDLHDIVAHNLTIIAMQTRTAAYVGTDEAARQAVTISGDSAKEALADLRRMLTLLQAEGLVAGEESAGMDAEGGATTLDLEFGAVKLGRGLENLGISTTVVTEGLDRDIPQSIQTALYRVLQEAVTNVSKHAGLGGEARIEIRSVDGSITLDVGNTLAAGPPKSGAGWLSSGNGMVGMKDRVKAFSGTFSAGRQKDWWWVRAEVPIY